MGTTLDVVKVCNLTGISITIYGNRYRKMEAVLEDPYILITDKNNQCTRFVTNT